MKNNCTGFVSRTGYLTLEEVILC